MVREKYGRYICMGAAFGDGIINTVRNLLNKPIFNWSSASKTDELSSISK